MKNNESNKKDTGKNTNYGKYLFLGVLTAVVVLFVMNYFKEDVPLTEKEDPYLWSAETDSTFVKNCYEKYKPQIKDDLDKQVAAKAFCKCMLEKVKSKYSEFEMHLVKDAEIKKWDEECRNNNWEMDTQLKNIK